MTKSIPWLKLKAEYLQGATPKELAKKYSLTSQQISNKVKRDKWKIEKDLISHKTTKNVQDKIQALSNNALEVLSEVMNNPLAENKDKVSAARAILDVSGLKSVKQEITADVKSEVKPPQWNKEVAKQVMKDIKELVDE